MTSASPYGWMMLGGIVVSLVLWSRIARRDERLLFIYIAALIGAFLGAKVVYILAEGWLHFGQPDMWLQLATGKTVLGALLGGYGAVELAKGLGYTRATGDWFALICPVGIILGRVGCLLHGCCLGKVCHPAWFTMADGHGAARWPAVPVEILFNLVAIVAFAILRHRQKLPGQHFHLYLMAYGLFRLVHEFFRDTPAILGPFTGYQIAAGAVATLGLAGFLKRRKQTTLVASQPLACERPVDQSRMF